MAFFVFLTCLAASSFSWASAILLRSPLGLPCLSLPSLLSWSALILMFSTVSVLLLCSFLFGALVDCAAVRLILIFFHCLSFLLLLSMIWSWALFLSSPIYFLTLLLFFGDVPHFPSSSVPCALVPYSGSLVFFLWLWGLCSSLSPDVLGIFFPDLKVELWLLRSFCLGWIIGSLRDMVSLWAELGFNIL